MYVIVIGCGKIGYHLTRALLAGAIGSALGLNSAGRRRNERPAWSWIGFLVGSAVVASNLILLIAYWMLRLIRHV